MTGSSYRDIAADLRAQIESGALAPGARLPTEAELAGRYGVQRNIARLALTELVADGLVQRRRRLGSFVRDRDPVRVPFSIYQAATVLDPAHGPWEAACAALGIDGRTEVVSVQEVTATGRLAEHLEVPQGEPLVCRTRHMVAGDVVAQIQRAFMPLSIVQGTRLAGTGKVVGGAHAAFAALGIIPATATFWAVARNATGSERDTLGLVLGVPILETWRVVFDTSGRRIELVQTVSNAELATLVMDELPLRRES